MCGIAGVVHQDHDFTLPEISVQAMQEQLRHRGPDDAGRFAAAGAALVMRRLSIIDLAGGRQPIANEDESLWLIFNGELYNYLELRQVLRAKGHQFRTDSDSEVIVHAFEEYGPDCVTHFNGMFAFAIWDQRERSLFLARDRLGIKPLYYWHDERQLAFASELKSLLCYDAVPRELSVRALDLFLALEYIPAPWTIFSGIRKLPAGHWLHFCNGACQVQRYWEISPVSPPSTAAEASEQFVDLLRDAVRLRLRSDVPVGAFLSGGLDSSTILSFMHELHGPGMPSFSIGFAEDSYNELPYARLVAAEYGAKHYEAILAPDIAALTEELVTHFDEPFGDFSIFPTYLVSKLARETVKVVLSGDGGDELLGGYDTYVAQRWAAAYQRLPGLLRRQLLPTLLDHIPPQNAKKGLINKTKRFVEGGALPASLEHVRWMIFMDETAKTTLYSATLQNELAETNTYSQIAAWFAAAPFSENLARQQFVDVKSYLAENILTKVDRMSMATSLEVRVPFLDHRLVEYCLSLPSELKIARGQTKVILRRAMTGRLPQTILNKPKQGFSIPLKLWLRGPLRPLLGDLLAPDVISRRGYFEPATITRWRDEHLAGKVNHSHRLWALLVFELWCRRIWG